MLNDLKRKFFSEFSILALLFGLTLVIYIHNLSPSVYGGDSGDLISAVLARGVPHPSGYPLFTMLGIIFSYLPIASTPAWKVGLISSIFSSVSLVLIYLIVKELTKNRYLSLLSSLSLAFSYTFWLYAEIAEVIALNSFFILLLTYLAVKYINSKAPKYIKYIALTAGLSLTNNLSIVLIFPGIALSLLYKNLKILKNIKLILASLFLFLLGLTPYLYIPIAASSNPLVNWGYVVTWDNFVYMFFRKDYGWTSDVKFSSDILSYRIKGYVDYWRIYLNPLIPILAILGSLFLVIKRKVKLLSILLLSFILTGPFFSVYPRAYYRSFLNLASLEKFYNAGLIFSVLLIPFGAKLVIDSLNKVAINKKFASITATLFKIAFFLIPIVSLVSNFQRTNLKRVYIGDKFGYDILNNLPNNSVVLLSGDNEHFNSLYLQIAYGIRSDIYLSGRNEGFTKFHQARGLNEKEIEEYKTKFSGAILIPDIYVSLPNLVKNYPTFTDKKLEEIKVEDNELGKLIFVPYGIVYKLEFEKNFDLSNDEYLEKMNRITSSYHTDSFEKTNPLLLSNFTIAYIQRRYTSAFYEIASFLATHYDDKKNSFIYLKKALKMDPVLNKLE